MKSQILLIGGGGHCKSVIDVIEQEDRFIIAGIIDRKELIGQKVFGYEIIGSDDDLDMLYQRYKYAVVTVGQIQSPDVRIKLFDHLKRIGFILPAVISPRAYVSQYASIGEGTLILHDALINTEVKIGNNCIINTKALIEHESIVGDHCHISTACVLNGGTTIGYGSFVGSNAVSKEGASVAERSFIKAGSIIK
jgi:sugar O-acyltransferase (sialic acid O-acetyltransferase NeuD family)